MQFVDPKFKESDIIRKYILKYVINLERNLPGYKLVYISGPMSGILNYERKFEEVESFLKNKLDNNKYYIINPSKELNNIVDCFSSSYIDNLIFTTCVLENCDILVIDDRENNWLNSRGCLCEYITARTSAVKKIDIYSFDSLLKGESKICQEN